MVGSCSLANVRWFQTRRLLMLEQLEELFRYEAKLGASILEIVSSQRFRG